MFSDKTYPWRVGVNRVKGENVTDKSKPKLFEKAIDYITTSTSTLEEVVAEVLGLEATSCEAFRKLSIDNSLFLYKEITKEVTYLLAVCSLKGNPPKEFELKDSIDPKKFMIWLTKIGIFKQLTQKIEPKYLERISIGKEEIFFNNDYEPLKLAKLKVNIDSTPTDMHNNRYVKQKIKNGFDNFNNRCLGATNYWLQVIGNAYKHTGTQRNILKNECIKSLEIERRQGERLTSTFKDARILPIITNLHRGFNINNQFQHIHDVYTTSSDLSLSIYTLLELMINNKLPQLYAQLVTHNHAMGLVIVNKGNLIKILAYDPNDPKGYMSIKINPEVENTELLKNFFQQMPYLKDHDSEIVIKCNTFETPPQQFIKPKNNLEIYQETNHPNKLLSLGITTNNPELVEYAINLGAKLQSDCINLAAQYNNTNVVKFLIKKIPTLINYVDSFYCTPLTHAVSSSNLELVKILIAAGAQLDVKGAVSPFDYLEQKDSAKTIKDYLKEVQKSL